MEAELYATRRSQVGVLQPAPGGRRSGIPARSSISAFDQVMLDPNDARHVRGRRLLQEGSEQLRADCRLCLGRHEGRQDGGPGRLFADVRQRGYGHRRRAGLPRKRRSQYDRSLDQPVRVGRRRRASADDACVPERTHARAADCAQRDGRSLGYRSRTSSLARPPGERRYPAGSGLAHRRRGAVRRHLRPQHLAGHRLQPDEHLSRRSWPISTAAAPTGSWRSRRAGLQPGFQPDGAGQPAADSPPDVSVAR